jgi:hypothetical protein
LPKQHEPWGLRISQAQFPAFTVHAEWINRPSEVIVDKEGIARFAYYGTFWGDRPSIYQQLEMVRSGDYSFAAPKRLKAVSDQ